jgi:hypothetical protein
MVVGGGDRLELDRNHLAGRYEAVRRRGVVQPAALEHLQLGWMLWIVCRAISGAKARSSCGLAVISEPPGTRRWGQGGQLLRSWNECG